MKRAVNGFGAVLLLSACSGNPSKSECRQLVEHMVDIFTAGRLAGDAKVPKDYTTAVETWRRMLKDESDPTHEALMQMCTTQMSSGAADCIRAAKNERELAACFSR